jgi:hypothetical protein
MVVNTPLWPQENETPQERELRVQRLAQLVRSGQYAVHAQSLALALLDWDPRRGTPPKQSPETADRRRAYMREYMRRRRAEQLFAVATTRAEQALRLPADSDSPGD